VPIACVFIHAFSGNIFKDFKMANNNEKNEKLHKTVTLILKKKQFEVEKQKLISKSQYFAVLLSKNYIEHRQTEHMINYDIPLISLQVSCLKQKHFLFMFKNKIAS